MGTTLAILFLAGVVATVGTTIARHLLRIARNMPNDQDVQDLGKLSDRLERSTDRLQDTVDQHSPHTQGNRDARDR
jgi:predicted PurR-regulated permease PerM